MEKNRKIHLSDFPNNHDWLIKLAAEEKGKNYSKEVKDVISEVMTKVDQGIDPQAAFKEACTSAELLGMEMANMEKRTDIAAILYDKYEIDVNPVNLDKTPSAHPE